MKRTAWVAMLPFYLLSLILFIGIAKGSSDAVSAITQKMPAKRLHPIVIDAGHGGIDGGATSCTGVLESTINLEIALRLNDLMRFLGYETVMIRTTDTSIYTDGSSIAAQKVSDLKERVRIANERDGAVLVSIHQNIFSDSRYGGAQVFYGNNPDSKVLATSLQKNLVETVNTGSKRVSKAAKGVYLMEHVSVCGVLIECGFLSNPEEEANLRNGDYQKKLCCVIGATLSSFLDS